MTEISPSPRVFISYSHDFPEHIDRVLELFDRLRRDGIDCILDQCEPAPAEGWARWMDTHIQKADFVLMICSEVYYKRIIGTEKRGKGLGVRWEGHLIYEHIYLNETNNLRFIPILLKADEEDYIPTPLRAFPHYLAFTEGGYEELYRRLTNQPRDLKPALGKLKRLPPRERRHPGSAERVSVIPKGLRSFDRVDNDFFIELLPGPRDASGLPESIRFWKTKIELDASEESFKVGLIYGPSGCGKTSLINAGLVPQLSSEVITEYIESTSADTELKLSDRLRKYCVPPDATMGLKEVCTLLARGNSPVSGKKILIIIDQFEQWLNAHPRPSQEDELVMALRAVDGKHLQCLLMIRDDFWTATDRLFRQLKIDMIQGQNFRLVDLFDHDHARRVLHLFGLAYNRLPADLDSLSKEQHRFLDGAIKGLSQKGLIFPIRLSLFADLMKDRPWTGDSLSEWGGMAGVGLRFLEDTFNARTAVPKYKVLQEQLRAVLQALLPDQGDDIKGRMKSREELAATCALEDDPEKLNEALNVLDHELHLISPAEKVQEAKEKTSTTGGGHPGGYYQLTHDYMVMPLREWLTQERRKSWRGQAEMTLEERTAQWRNFKERRYLPTTFEFLRIVTAVPRNKWTPEQRLLLYRTARHHLLIMSLISVSMVLAAWGAWAANGPLHGQLLVQAILSARPDELDQLIEHDLTPYHRWADPLLKSVISDQTAGPDKKLRASLALVGSDDSQLDYLSQRMLDCTVEEYPVIRKILVPYHKTLEPQLWTAFRTGPSDKVRFYAGMTLALYDPHGKQWTPVDINYLAEQLLKSNPDDQKALRSYLRPMANPMLEPLRVMFSDEAQRDTVRRAAALALTDYRRDDPELLADLVSSATAEQYDVIYQSLHSPQVNLQAVKDMLAKIAEEQPGDNAQETERARIGKRRAGAAITLMHLGERESIFSIFKVQRDPESLTQFVHRLRDRNIAPAEILECLDRAHDDTVRYALLLSLGEYRSDAISNVQRDTLLATLLHWYRDDPSSAVHSAARWVLQSWGAEDELTKIDQIVSQQNSNNKKQWFIRQVGDKYLTFVVFEPGEYVMGSPDTEKGHQQNEKLHPAVINRAFALCDQEVTKGLFQQFQRETNRSVTNIDEWSPEDSDPAVKVSWYEAILFCRWLTIKVGMSEADQCYDDPEKLTKGTDGFPAEWPVHFDRPGFRLPTETEWEYACRAGTRTTYNFGSDKDLLWHYGWFLNNSSSTSGHMTHTVRSLMPNLRGLFDMHGNVWEWCDDWYGSKSGYDENIPVDSGGVRNRLIRGGSWHSDEGYNRAASRYFFPPETKDNLIGFRIVGGITAAQ